MSEDRAIVRAQAIVGQLSSSNDAAVAAVAKEEKEAAPVGPGLGGLRWCGWGYNDTEFVLKPSGQVALSGSRYLFSGKTMPSLRSWMEEKAGLNVKFTSPPGPHPAAPEPIRNADFLAAVKGKYKRLSFDGADRYLHAHGHTAQELFSLRYGKLDRIPDVVIYPGGHDHVEAIVKAAHEHNVVIIPYGGGTSVSHALLCPVEEKRMIVSLDMHEMNAIKWVNRESMLACIEAGIVGKDLDQRLRAMGLVMGHEPDSTEFSTLGGWVATRASGMRKNKYGNIEDIVVKIKCVTPTGTIEKSVQVPRQSTGPDVHHIIMGSEGILGVVTEVVVRLRPAPETVKYGSIVFPTFESGVGCLYELAMMRAAPVSIRLVDNMQFQFGQALKPEQDGWLQGIADKMKKWYVTKHMKFDVNTMVAATLLFEGSKEEVAAQEKVVYRVAEKYGGIKGGEENGIRGYFLTYMIAYLRDFGYGYSFISESFETSVPWDQVLPLCSQVKALISRKAKELGVKYEPFVSCRVTQTYDTGACVYFYLGFVWEGLKDPVGVFSQIEHAARDEILRLGGSLSHHHGIGKLRQSWLESTISSPGYNILKSIKESVDPKNVFGSGNLVNVVGER